MIELLKLGVNVDHVATVREARGIDVPDPVAAAVEAELHGADLITVHRRLDQRHIQDRDVEILRRTVKTPLNLEMAVNSEVIDKALQIGPDKATLVPESREEVTTEGGLAAAGRVDELAPVVEQLREAGIQVAFFVDPDEKQLRAARNAGASGVELHTGDYAETPPESSERGQALQRLETAAFTAAELDLEVYAGHGLNYRNVKPVAAIDPVVELNIGHSIVSRALMVGIGSATERMKNLMLEAD